MRKMDRNKVAQMTCVRRDSARLQSLLGDGSLRLRQRWTTQARAMLVLRQDHLPGRPCPPNLGNHAEVAIYVNCVHFLDEVTQLPTTSPNRSKRPTSVT
jgi:hypothetical protein